MIRMMKRSKQISSVDKASLLAERRERLKQEREDHEQERPEKDKDSDE